MSRVEKNKDKYNKVSKFKKRKATNNKFDDDKEFEHKEIVDFEVRGNKYIPIREGEDRKEVLRKFEERENPDNIAMTKNEQYEEFMRKNIQDQERRDKLVRFTRQHDKEITDWQNERNDDTDKKIYEKTSKGKGLTLKEYYQYLGRKPEEGDIILAGGRNGEDVRVGKNGKLEVIENFKKRKKSNK